MCIDGGGLTVTMSNEQVELLEKALSLYSFTIEQRRNGYDTNERAEFFEMVRKLSELTGLDLDYYD